MIRGTTPKLTVSAEGVDFTTFSEIHIYIKQYRTVIDKICSVSSQSKSSVECTLSQNETIGLDEGECYVQVRAKNESGQVIASIPQRIDVDQLLKDVIL